MQGNFWKLGLNQGELMEGGHKCRGTDGRWAQVQGNLWKVGPSAGELMEGGPECRGTYGRWAQVQGTEVSTSI